MGLQPCRGNSISNGSELCFQVRGRESSIRTRHCGSNSMDKNKTANPQRASQDPKHQSALVGVSFSVCRITSKPQTTRLATTDELTYPNVVSPFLGGGGVDMFSQAKQTIKGPKSLDPICNAWNGKLRFTFPPLCGLRLKARLLIPTR